MRDRCQVLVPNLGQEVSYKLENYDYYNRAEVDIAGAGENLAYGNE